jgi:hypothetical protein
VIKETAEGERWKGQKKASICKRAFVVVDKSSARVPNKATNVLEKAQGRMEALFGGNNYFSILNSFSSQHFVNVASSCGIDLGSNEEKELEVISTVLAKERAQPLLTETRARIEREKQEEINKNKLMIVPVKGQENKDVKIERACASVIEGELESSSHDDLGEIKAPRVTVRKKRGEGGQGLVTRICF